MLPAALSTPHVFISSRLFSTASSRLWKTSSTSWLSTNCSCLSLPSSRFSSSRGSFSTVPTVQRTQRRTASKTFSSFSSSFYFLRSFSLFLSHSFFLDCFMSPSPKICGVKFNSSVVGVTISIMGRTRKTWRGESGRDTTFTTTTSCGLCSPSSLFPLARDGLSEYLNGISSDAGWGNLKEFPAYHFTALGGSLLFMIIIPF